MSRPIDALVSFHYYAADKLRPLVAGTAPPRFSLIADSGAFSARTMNVKIDITEYAAWVARWRGQFEWAASLDVIGDPHASLRNWRTLRDRHALDLVPTVHAGEDMTWLDTYAAEGADFVGLGGMAGKGQGTRAYRWAVNAFRHARDRYPQMRFHLWGTTHRRFLDHLPAYSADSSGIAMAHERYGKLRLFDPRDGTDHNAVIQHVQKNNGIYALAPLLRRVYGVDPAAIARSHPGNAQTLRSLAVASLQQYAAWLRNRRTVSPPTYGVQSGRPLGPRIYVVAASPAVYLSMAEGL